MDKRNLFIVIVGMLICGCATLKSPSGYDSYWHSDMYRRDMYVYNHPDLDSITKTKILKGRICIGMTKDDVQASWGEPYKINRTVTIWAESEQWIYGVPSMHGGLLNAQYLYFDGNILTGFQDIE